MRIQPYKRTPEPPTVALLTATEDGAEWAIVDEHGATVNPDAWPDGVRAWCSFDTARALVTAGQGEAVCWKGEELRWRHRRLDKEGWINRPSDVHVLRLPLDDLEPRLVVRDLARWRDWLARYGAAPTGSTGSAAWSLLRATLEQELRTGEPLHASPPLLTTLGGRQLIGPAGPGVFRGNLEQIDMPAAYASTLGTLPYGGRWLTASRMELHRDPEWWATENRPVFVRARVRIPATLDYGPLPRRPRKRIDPYLALGLGAEFPTGATMQGFWTWQELEQAVAAGCRLEKILETWGHFAGGRQPFAPWWDAVQAGRRMPGLAGLLAKSTGNALWGRFCMDGRTGRRVIRSKDRRGLVQRSLPFIGGQPPAHDLAETVSGRIRARLHAGLLELDGRVLSAHTDGAWIVNPHREPAPDGWRRKMDATRLDLLGPQTLRYTPRKGASGPVAVVAGVPYRQAAASFEKKWTAAGYPAGDSR